jgi:hypothetical protein
MAPVSELAHSSGVSGKNEAPESPAKERGRIAAVAVPTEHGGWGLTIEPGLLGLLVAPSVAGLMLALAAVVAFLARAPTKVLLVDAFRRRRLPRTRVALAVAVFEVLVLAALVVGAALTATADHWWIPALVVVPLIAVELWFDMRSRSRRLIPELAGAVGIAGVTTMIVLADDGEAGLAIGLWVILAARAVTSITWVRGRIMALHGRPTDTQASAWADVTAAAAVGLAVAFRAELMVGAAAVVALIVIQRIAGTGRPASPKRLGLQQMAFGFAVVLLTAIGVWTI